MFTLASRLISSRSYHCLRSNFTPISLHKLKCNWAHAVSCHHHHHHVPEGLGVFPVPWSSRWSWSLHLFLGRPMFLRLLVYIVVLVLVFCLCPSSVHVVATFPGIVVFPLPCSVLPFFSLIHWFLCGIYVGQNSTGIGFSLTTLVCPSQYHSTNAPYTFIRTSLMLYGR